MRGNPKYADPRHIAVMIAIIVLLVASPAITLGGEPKPTADLVSVEDGKFLIEGYSVCRLELPQWVRSQPSGKFQVKMYSEAPKAGVISRDNFVGLTTQISMVLRLGFAARIPGLPLGQALDALKCTSIDAPIGKVDLEINTYMTKDGVQIETVDTTTGRTSRVTETWDHLWGE